MSDPNDDANGNGRKGLKERGVDWLFSQGVSTVLLLMIMVMLGWGGKWAIEMGIPAHLQMIQHGYDKNAAVFSAAIAELLAARKEERAADAEERKAILEALKRIKGVDNGKHDPDACGGPALDGMF